jgi:adenylosuccinate synthase
MKNKVIIGIGFGDEGKGLFTDYICSKSKNPLVIRFSGGHQVGHTVVYKNIRHMFSNFGSGSLRGIPTYWSKFCTFEPVGFLKELKVLQCQGIIPFIFLDERCPITTPYDIKENQNRENKNYHGSIGVGFGTTIERENNYYSLTFNDIFYREVFYEKLRNISTYYKKQINLDGFIDAIEKIKISKSIIQKRFGIPKGYTDHVYEGNQGLMLDRSYGFFPNVTRSDIGINNIKHFTKKKLEIYLVTRAYQTRHGNGYMTNETLPHNIKINPNESNKTNKYQGNFRRSILDVSLLEYAINKDEYIRFHNNKNLVITCLDHIQDEYRFTYNGNIIYCDNENNFIENISKILKINNVYISRGDKSDNVIKYKLS